MVDLKGTGAPTRDLQASIGDIYTDKSTGKRYKCSFAIRIGGGSTFDTSWVELKNSVKPNLVKHEPVKEVIEKEAVEEPVEENLKEEAPAEPEQKKPKNYTNYSKSKNKQTAK